MISLIRSTSENPNFIELVKLLDTYLAFIDGEEHSFYAQFNKIDLLKNVVVAFDNEKAVGCGAFKPLTDHKVEVKRMFVKEEFRGQKIASQILNELELWAQELKFQEIILETGIRQSAAIALYEQAGYHLIPNYGQYVGVSNSVCFLKIIPQISPN